MNHAIYIKTTKINAPVQRLFAWHERNGAILRLTPPWAPLKMIARSGDGVKKGVKVIFRLSVFKIPMVWEAEHFDYQENKVFKDRQIKGPFSKWEHTHRFYPDGLQSSIMEDRVEFKLPFGWLSRPFYRVAKKEFERMFAYRHRVLKYDLEHHANRNENKIGDKKKRILVSGASGTIGSMLVPFLQTCGHEVVRLVRTDKDLSPGEYFWDPYKGILDLETIGHIDAVINLNGVDISRGRWTDRQKKQIIDSRIIPTRLLVDKMKSLDHKPEVFISSSAIGYYGEGGAAMLTEASSMGNCFISKVCRQWEDASADAQKAGIRTVQLRIGVVLTPSGGALARMELPFKIGCGVRLSRGGQYMSWISMDDAVSGILHILNNDKIQGKVNLTAPNPVTNKEFSKTLAKVFSKQVFFVIPRFVALVLWGQMGKETLLASARVKPEKLLKNGFLFQHKTLLGALKDTLGR
ncbi:TIGR01777 family oxidoreductase [Desulfobacula toluolica]|uniref:NAD-dependent epimerase/dehydratase n=1 Tax=Desulfobacula toluolica (strain DSM 7467 / Tol2) TaxID=651182 RepID=K0NFK7_DESTT|nr:TIGR01777 family oxidoreductase [Desulfobacula toluolica]CCK79906.1 NAD-dependent epimerase/dehydratase [Desulfobacula toluolica Tol2]